MMNLNGKGIKMKKTLTIVAFLSLVILSIAGQRSYAQNDETAVGRALDKLNTIGKDTGLGSVETKDPNVGIYYKIADVINILLGLAGIAATILIIVAGTRWIMASGNEEDIKKAKDTIKGAVIGIMIILFAFILVNFVINNLLDIVNKKTEYRCYLPGECREVTQERCDDLTGTWMTETQCINTVLAE